MFIALNESKCYLIRTGKKTTTSCALFFKYATFSQSPKQHREKQIMLTAWNRLAKTKNSIKNRDNQ